MVVQTIQLSDNSKLGYARFGQPGGLPAFYFHGLPGAAVEGELFHQACMDNNIELVSVERFGYGKSTAREPGQHGERYVDTANAIKELADQLGFEHFYLLAVSGGGPYALACASFLNDRVITTSVVCGLGPVVIDVLRNQMRALATVAFDFAHNHPMLLRLIYGVPLQLATRFMPGKVVDILGKRNPKVDQLALSQPDANRIMQNAITHAFMGGINGAKYDLLAAQQEWPFALNKIKNLQLWHGDIDPVVPLSHSQWLHERIKDSTLKIKPGESHFSLPINHAGQIIKSMIS